MPDQAPNKSSARLVVMVPAALLLFGVVGVVVIQVFHPGDNTAVIGLIFAALAAGTPGVISTIKLYEVGEKTAALDAKVEEVKVNTDGKLTQLLEKTGQAAYADGRAETATAASVEAARLAKESAELAVTAVESARAEAARAAAEAARLAVPVPAKVELTNGKDNAAHVAIDHPASAAVLPAKIEIVNSTDNPVPTIPVTNKERP